MFVTGINGNFNNFFFCLVTCGSQVASTKVRLLEDAFSTGFLDLPINFTATNLRSDFTIQVEVFGLRFQKANSKKEQRTPKKNRLLASAVCSPASQSEYRDPIASSYGSLNLTLKNCRQKNFFLHNFVTGSALAGSIDFQIALSANYDISTKGFLNFYEIKSESGSWNRRWCKLDGNVMSIWRYTEDAEQNKPPIGQIDLRYCINPTIEPVSYETCARKFTIMLLLAGSKNTDTSKARYLLTKQYKDMVISK